jgi:hypothetical protein
MADIYKILLILTISLEIPCGIGRPEALKDCAPGQEEAIQDVPLVYQ